MTVEVNNTFIKQFRCFSFDYLIMEGEKKEKDIKNIECLNQIVMPKDCLEHIVNFKIPSPFYFQIESRKGKKTYASVHSYSHHDKIVFLPKKIMEELGISDDERVVLTSVNIPKAKSLTFKTIKEFGELENPKLVIDKNLRDYTVFYENQKIDIIFAKKRYQIIIKNLKPNDVVSCIDTDVDIQFEFT